MPFVTVIPSLAAAQKQRLPNATDAKEVKCLRVLPADLPHLEPLVSLPDLPHPFAERLHALVTDAGSVADLRRYFGIDLPPGAAAFTGARFEALGGGGDRPAVADAVTAEDLIAVQALSVTVPAAAVLDLLEGHVGTQLSTLLRAIPRDLDMADATEADLAPSSPAHKAWHLLRDQPGIGWVTAGKILARKRPRLLPVYGGVGRPRSFWHALHSTLRADDCALQRELLILRQAAGIPETVSALRVCDVVVWMRHHTEHQDVGCAWE
ncbi:DUF6308 family protein [Streptomyces sp900116325]|uniref:DUF6308 family protein n=1 Tax=Streptomyces sp. 900116325 TaxID=3154295 RepID=A0ABV2UMU7_9ACTN